MATKKKTPVKKTVAPVKEKNETIEKFKELQRKASIILKEGKKLLNKSAKNPSEMTLDEKKRYQEIFGTTPKKK